MKNASLKVAIYSRVSTLQQSDIAQHEELENVCASRGWTVVRTYRETASGTLNNRTGLNALLADARRRRFDAVVVWSADRLGRSMRHLVSVMGELHDCGVQLYSFKQGVDTTTPMGSMLWQFLGIFAEFENNLRRERQSLGIAKAKERGVHFGRPKLCHAKEKSIIQLRGQGLAINRIARELRVGTGSVVRVLQKHELHTSKAREPKVYPTIAIEFPHNT